MSVSREPTAVIVGATGAVGEDLRRLVGERQLPVGEVRLVASARSAGRRLDVRGEQVEVRALAPEVFDGAEVAFFSAGGGISREWAPVAAERGAVVVDNSSAWRMHPEVPLVDADVNPEAAADHPHLLRDPLQRRRPGRAGHPRPLPPVGGGRVPPRAPRRHGRAPGGPLR